MGSLKIGFVVSFFDFRNDIRRVIMEIERENTVVVFCRKGDKEKIESFLPGEVSVRVIDEAIKSLLNTFWFLLFGFMRRIPTSKHNYYLMELFKIYNVKDYKVRKKGLKLFRIHRLLPKIIPYDFLLRRLSFSGKTQISDIDRFVFFSEVADDLLLARVVKEKGDVRLYIYSWDHPCKHTRFSKHIKYQCWSDELKKDLSKLQGISPHKIKVTGASQFGYLDEFFYSARERKRKYPFKYYYFGCAIGIKSLVKEEISVIKQMASRLQKIAPNLKLVVRPYPVLDDWKFYEELSEIKNIIIEDDYRNGNLAVTDENILSKLDTVYFSDGFFHLGTTLGLESALIGIKSFIIDFGYQKKTGLSLYSFIHQYQNDKYLVNLARNNCLESIDEFEEFLKDPDNEKYMEIVKEVKPLFPIKSFKEFSENILNG